MRLAGTALLATISAIGLCAAASAEVPMPDGDWRTINRDLAATRYSPLDEINKSNVTQLQQAWSYPLRTFSTAVPIVVDGVMYVPAGFKVAALDAATGKELWVHEEPKPEGQGGFGGGFSGRGLGYWAGNGKLKPRILVMLGSKMVALDAKTGKPVTSFGAKGYADVGVSYGGTPTIVGDVAVIGAASLENPRGAPGNPRAFDVKTGKKLWEFQTVPKKGEPFNETWGDGWEGRGGTNMWGFAATVDADTDTVYLPIGGPAHNYYGGDRPGSNLFGNSVVAVDAKTGKYKWHFQSVHHDLWDIDMPTAGPLVDVTIDGKRQKILANINKNSLFFVLGASDGKPALPVEERPVPAGNVPGEYYSPTQPFPVKTPPLSRVAMSYDDIVTAKDTNPEHAAACKAMWEKAGGYINVGPYTPFVYRAEGDPVRSTIQFPGGIGGVNWGGPAADPTTGIVYMNALDTSLVGWVEKVPEGTKPYSFDATESPDYDRASVDGKGPFFSFQAPLSGKYDAQGRPEGTSVPCYKPPWARLTAVDANTGEIKWAVPLGLYEELPAGKQVVGNAGSAGPTVTAGGLVFVGATNDKRFRAFDAATGKELWEALLSNNANANPMSYRGSNGKQYVAINAGGAIVSFALPGTGT
ncbi:PQQ-binding-like beta-propeller repeat protein [Erythrobacter sp. SG61-1L]|uniref:outer membrane protein assembly factor BamB family protein n=1 Tax=Erythrobacter sp. SG61-1L TaxID=1603897 RepID=UPI0006C8F80B|nr:PQQ-binding-like beta-propeller repeat protein [Erythrobacter sp. SG61-1L]